jgi:D-beta-D-heptose 7-phosphate kinase/D-beta-D-heptose 1-phosphate adenosyltransferase
MNIWVNGCFDILHTGHIDLLEYAKYLKYHITIKNTLIVGIDSDRRVKELKGDDRPINNQEDRRKMLLALKFVDDVVIYDSEDEMCDFIRKYNIDYIVIGDEYKDKQVLCRENSKYDVVFYPKNEKSTTELIKKLRAI